MTSRSDKKNYADWRDVPVAQFKYELDKVVIISASGESGLVIGRAEYTHAENNYLVRYVDGSGRAVENWWAESALHSPSSFGSP